MVPSAFISTPNARVDRCRSMFFSSCTIRIRRVSQSGVFTSRFMKNPRSSRTMSCFASPAQYTRISPEALPPSTGRSCTSATFMPRRAAATAAHVPGIPPPTTTKSAFTVSSALDSSIFSGPSGGRPSPSALNTIPAQRPSKPVRSRSATVASPFATVTVPPSSHAHSRGPAPNSLASGLPSTSTRKRPGAPSAQFFARTQTRYLPAAGNATRAFASRTRTPSPCAMRYGEPITSMNCASSPHPPASKLCG